MALNDNDSQKYTYNGILNQPELSLCNPTRKSLALSQSFLHFAFMTFQVDFGLLHDSKLLVKWPKLKPESISQKK
jgi:hypothetical protein